MLSTDKKCDAKVKQKKKVGRGEEEPLKKDAKIGIVGGGIGGLSTALALKRAGFSHVVVYERDECFDQYRRDGYGLTLTYNPKGPLAKLGILEQVCLHDTPSRSHYLFQAPKGDILGYYGRAFSAYNDDKNDDGIHHQRVGFRTGQRGNLRIPRQKLREILLHELLLTEFNTTEGTDDNMCIEVRWGKRLIDFVHSSNIVTTPSPCSADDIKSQAYLKEEQKKNEGSPTHDDFVTLFFADSTSDHVELLIAADGIYSTVQAKVEEDQHSNGKNHDKLCCSINAPPPSTLKYIGIMLINGITLGFHHPLLDERGFYTVDGENRLFTMPFEGSYVDDHLKDFLSMEGEQLRECSATPSTRRRTMWQLSFRLPDVTLANQLRQGGPKCLLEEALRRCNTWHPPVCDMLRSTPLDCIWGSGLMDRMPNVNNIKVKNGSLKTQSRRIVILGDAMHAMSPFKGQGANQALSDGPLLVDWLCRKGASLTVALSHFEREMIHRTRNKVKASREAAIYLHSPQVLQTQHDFAGVPKEFVNMLLHELQMRNITAHLGGQLDMAIYRILHELCIVTPNMSTRVNDEIERGNVEVEMLLRFAQEGNLSELRKVSLLHHHSYLIRSSRMRDTGETCLHLAAKNGHYDVCRWLLSEGYFSSPEDYLDSTGHCPLVAAIAGVADPQVIAMILATSSKYDREMAAIPDQTECFALKRQKLLTIVQKILDNDRRSTVMQLLMKSKYRETSRS